ncbi:MAG: 4'-phosphopantetheinyl transferase superfamily protein [Bdellovibrionales bacterium]
MISTERLNVLRTLFQDPHLLLRFHSDWKEGVSIRVDLAQHFLEALEPSSPPLTTTGKLSLSHSAHGGAWIYSETAMGIGVDLESQNRLKPETIERISSASERDSAPNLSYIWTGKEAVFKSLYPDNQNTVLSHITLADWQSRSLDLWTFHAFLHGKPLNGLGCAFDFDKISFSCFIRR